MSIKPRCSIYITLSQPSSYFPVSMWLVCNSSSTLRPVEMWICKLTIYCKTHLHSQPVLCSDLAFQVRQNATMHIKTRQPALIFPTSQPNATFWKGVAHPGRLWPPNSKLGRDFCTMHLPPPRFIILSSSCLLVRKLSCLQTNTPTHKHTNKQTDAAENIRRSSLRYDVR